jgi:phage terminase large subunit GpA-like protein
LLFARMRINEPGAGYMHFSDKLNDEYFLQLTAEKIITKFVRGYKKRVFQKIRPRNEALDCMVYSMAAYAILNVDVNTISDRIKSKPEPETKSEPIRQQRPFIPPMSKGFVNAWR